jgi:hypothetical protein
MAFLKRMYRVKQVVLHQMKSKLFGAVVEQLSSTNNRLNLCLELTGFTLISSSQLGSLKHTQLFLSNQLLPAI